MSAPCAFEASRGSKALYASRWLKGVVSTLCARIRNAMVDADTAAISLAILRYRDRVSKMGRYSSLFDVALMANAHNIRIVVHVEERAVDVIDDFLTAFKERATEGTMHMIWCKRDDTDARWCTVHGVYHMANHFMLLVPLLVPRDVPLCDVVHEPMPVETWAASRGYVVRDTIADGNCAIDCLAAFLGLERSPKSWLSIRMKLADLCIRVCASLVWHRAFLHSGETAARLDDSSDRPANTWEKKRILLASKGLASGTISFIGKTAAWSLRQKPSGAVEPSLPAVVAPAPVGDVVPAPALAIVPAGGAVVPAGDASSEADIELASAVAWASGCSQKSILSKCGRASVQLWMGLMDVEQRLAVVEAYRVSKQQPHQAFGPICPVLRRKRRYNQTLLSFRESIGRACAEWLQSPEGRESARERKHWARAAEKLGLAPLAAFSERRHVHQFVRRCHEQYSRSAQRHGVIVRESAGRRSVPAWASVPRALRKRKRGAQGNPGKTPDLGTALYQWFVDHRTLIKGRTIKRLMANQARALAMAISMETCSNGVLPDPPVIDGKWLARWRHQWGVNLRRPTTRYKVSRQVLKSRLKLFWSNILAVRFFFTKCFGVDPIQEQYDQKGVHYNESGSKNAPTYEMPYTTDVVLRENHAQTRSRISWMTGCVSDVVRAGRPIPLEQLFKATSGKRILKELEVPDAKRYTLQTSPSGSYRVEHVMRFLERHLLPWSEERAKLKDYRILSLDAYACHKDSAIEKLAWDRGYVYASGVMVPGGATGVVQGPDTDLHAWVESELIAMQDLEQTAKLIARPHKTPSSSRQDMVNYATTIWEAADHSNAARSFKRNGLSNSLDGDEDHLISRSARELWIELGMSAVRDVVRAEVEAAIAGLEAPRPEDVFALITSYDSLACGDGEFVEGQELEVPLQDGECPYAGDVESDSSHDPDPHEVHGTASAGGAQVCTHGGSDEAKSPESAPPGLLSDLRKMETLLHVAKTMEDKSTIGLLETRREKLLRQLRRGDADNAVAASRFLAAQKEEAANARAEAALQDAENQILKEKKKAKRDAEIALTMSKKKKVPLPLPAPTREGATADAAGPKTSSADVVATEGPKTSSVDVVAKVGPKTSSADVVAKVGPKTSSADVVAKVGPKTLPPGSTVFAVEVDTAARLEHVLLRLGADWAHDHKQATFRWTAQDIMKESARYRKNELVLQWSRYFRRTTSFPTSKEKGHLELFVVKRIMQLNVVQRRVFFDKQFALMQKRDCAATGQEKCTAQHNTYVYVATHAHKTIRYPFHHNNLKSI